jgi:hypothetical protein
MVKKSILKKPIAGAEIKPDGNNSAVLENAKLSQSARKQKRT